MPIRKCTVYPRTAFYEKFVDKIPTIRGTAVLNSAYTSKKIVMLIIFLNVMFD